jgi:hypothetical protein
LTEIAATFSIPEFLYEEGSFGVFVLVTLILGGGAATLAGRAIAGTWRPWWQVVAYGFVLGGAVRFKPGCVCVYMFLSAQDSVVDLIIFIHSRFLGLSAARASQMITQYGWLNESEGPMRWRRKVA